MASAFVDSASPGKNEVDSLTSASENLPGRLAANEPKIASTQIAATTHFERRPAENARENIADFYRTRRTAQVSESRSARNCTGSFTGVRQLKRSQT